MSAQDLIDFVRLKGVTIILDSTEPVYGQIKVIMYQQTEHGQTHVSQIVPTDHFNLALLGFMYNKITEASGQKQK